MPPGKQHKSPRPILAFRLLVVVCTLSLVITLTVSTVRLYRDYHEARVLVKEHVNNAAESIRASVAEGLWRLDAGILRLEMQSILAFPDVSFAEVREISADPQPLSVSVGERSAGPSVDQVFPLIYTVQGKEHRIGSLYVQASLDDLREKTIGTAIDILVNQAVNTFCVALFTFFVLYRLVTRHLADIARKIATVDFRREPLPLSLKRRSTSGDELQQVVDALNGMSNRLYAAYVTERNAEIERNDERALAEAKLHSSEQRLRAILEATPVPMCITSAISGKFLYTNQPFRALLGIEGKESWPFNASDLYNTLADRDHYLHELHQHGTMTNVELQLKKRDGTIFWAMITTTLTNFEGSLAVFAGINDITERKALEIKLINSREQLRRLSAHMESVREEERKNIALEIHDELGQLLTALKMDVSLMRLDLQVTSPLFEKLNEMQQLIENTISIVRNVASNLRPASLNLGIIPALEWLSSDFSRRHKVECEFQFGGLEPSLENSVATALFRIAQESLTNVARHAKASRIELQLLSIDTTLELKIIDNGLGFNVRQVYARYPFGLLGMAERARLIGATFTIASEPGGGATVSVHLSNIGATRDAVPVQQ
jgi:PAS domain S-box-containing protein